MQSKPLNVHDFTCQLIIQKSIFLLKTWQLNIQKTFRLSLDTTRSSFAWPMWKRSSTVRLEYKERNFCSTPNWAPVEMCLKKKVFGPLDKCINTFCTPPWLVLFSLLSRLDFSIFDWILAWIYVFLKYCPKTQGFLTPGFFIPLREFCVEANVSSSLLGSCELLQAPSSTSCSRIALFLHSGAPVSKYQTSR